MTKRIFLDTNIIIDVLERRAPFYVFAANIMNLGVTGEVELYVSTLTIVNCMYIVRKKLGKLAVLEKIRMLRRIVRISPMNEIELDNALLSNMVDLEDAVQYNSALAAGCDMIITRNVKHFPKYGIPIITADDYFS